MKLSARQIEPFVQNPDPKARAILLYGPDEGLARERLQIIAKKVVADLNDPFNVSKFAATDLSETPSKLDEEARAISMMGGERVVMIHDMADKYTAIIKSYLEDPSRDTLVLIQAGDLPAKSSLRKLFETQKNAAALPCYIAEGQDLLRHIQDHLRQAGFQPDMDALYYLSENLVGDQAQMRSEIEKLITYMGEERKITLNDAMNNTGNLSEHKVEALIYSCLSGQMDVTDKLLHGLYAEGISGVYVLRALLGHLRLLQEAQNKLRKGEPFKSVAQSLRIFFKMQNAFQSQLSMWDETKILTAMRKVSGLEAELKQTGAAEQILLARGLLGLARMARARRAA